MKYKKGIKIMLTKSEQRNLGAKYLEEMGCYKPYLKAYKDKGIVTMYEGYGGYYVDETSEPELFKKIKEVEKEYNGTVYSVIHSRVYDEDHWAMMWISANEDDNDENIDKNDDGSCYVFSYVWNSSYEPNSEFGSIVVKPALGGLLRIG